ncbi:hypothetical protein RQP46_010626 [Phenoliferia psychrophenolica]
MKRELEDSLKLHGPTDVVPATADSFEEKEAKIQRERARDAKERKEKKDKFASDRIRDKEREARELKDKAKSPKLFDFGLSSEPAKTSSLARSLSGVGAETFYGSTSKSLPKANLNEGADDRRRKADKQKAADKAEARNKPEPKPKEAKVTVVVDSDEDDEPSSSSKKRSNGDDVLPKKKKKKNLGTNGVAPSKKASKSGGRSSPPPDIDSMTLASSSPEKEPPHLTIEQQLSAAADAKKAAKKAKRKKIKDPFGLDSSDGSTGESDSDSDTPMLPAVDPDDEALDLLLREHDEEQVRQGEAPDLLLQPDDEVVDNGPLCPFCSAPLPDSPSARLVDLQKYLVSQPHARPNRTAKNPNGVRLPVVETASFCRKHDEERTIIPEGIAHGWPQTIDWDKLDDRVARKTEHLTNVIFKQIPCDFLTAAKVEWETKGARKMNNVLSEWGSFDIELPGYYGPRGFELMVESLRKYLVSDANGGCLSSVLAAPLPVDAYLRRVLLPELAVLLTAEDLKLSYSAARDVVVESRAFGKALHPNSEEDRAWAEREEEKEEKEAKRKVEEADKEKRDKKKRKDDTEAAKKVVGRKKLAERNDMMDDEDAAPVPAAAAAKPALRVPKRMLELQAAAAKAKEAAAPPPPRVPAPNKGKGKAKPIEVDSDSDDDEEVGNHRAPIAKGKAKVPPPPPAAAKVAPPKKKQLQVSIDSDDTSDDDSS